LRLWKPAELFLIGFALLFIGVMLRLIGVVLRFSGEYRFSGVRLWMVENMGDKAWVAKPHGV